MILDNKGVERISLGCCVADRAARNAFAESEVSSACRECLFNLLVTLGRYEGQRLNGSSEHD